MDEHNHPDPEMLRARKFQNGVYGAHIDAFWLSLWIADIVPSAKKIRDLDALRCVLENTEQNLARAHCAFRE